MSLISTQDNNLSYWKEKLRGLSVLELPTDYLRPPVQSTRGAEIDFMIDKELLDSLEQLSHQQGVSLFMTLLSGFKVLLHRYSSQEDIGVGIPFAKRTRNEVEELVGFFVNILVLRSVVNSNTGFIEFLHQVKVTTLEAYEHQDVPFEKVVEVVVKERDLSRNPLFQVMLVLQNNAEVSELPLGEVKLSGEAFAHDSAKFDISFFITETASGLQGRVEYATDLYSEATIVRMVDHFKTLLSSIVASPQQKIGELTMLTKEEEQQLLVEFNDTAVDYPRDKTIVDLFEEQAAKTPHSIALVFEEEQLSYKELNEKASQLAHYLRSRGVKEETLVPICIERSLGMIVGILGILKAGGAYVPIDPEYPQERISYMLEDTGAALVVTSKESKIKLQASADVEIIDLDRDWSTLISKLPTVNGKLSTANNQRSTNLAYVIYTSGSTGKPKGVMIEHRNVVSLVKGVDYVSLSDKDILLSTGSPSFDATTFEYWGMLLNGGQLILCRENTLLDSELLKEQIEKRKVTKMWFTSSLFNQLVGTDINIFARLDTILVGGEKLSEQHIKKIRQAYPSIKIVNGYGPTENTTFSLTYSITDIDENNSIPIGRSLTNRSTYILNEKHQLVPLNITGEIYLGGAGLGRGYLDRPELTKDKFIKNPFSTEGDSRLYRTGDLGRWLPDGKVEYLGRIDDQVKIRGFRIELGEIESALQQCEGVSQGAVLAREDRSGSKHLVGYVVTEDLFDKEAVITELKRRLPEYMVPALWMELKSLPLTANGKVDRKALPDPDNSELSNNNYVAPRNEMEEKLAGIWREVLKKDRIGIYDDFFKLGGHSLLAIQLIPAIRKQLQVKLAPNDLFIHPTIEGLASKIKDQNKELPKPAIHVKYLVPLKPEGNKTPLYIVCGGGGTATLFREFVEMLNPEQPVYALQPPINIEDSKVFPKNIEEIANLYIDEILMQNPKGPYALSGHCLGGIVAFEMAKQMKKRDKKIELLAMFDAFPPSKQKKEPGTFRNLFHIRSFKIPSRLALQIYLFTHHFKVAVKYKIIHLKAILHRTKNKMYRNKEIAAGLEVFNKTEMLFKTASENYDIQSYDNEILAFYVKEYYYYTDKEYNIIYGKKSFDENKNELWKQYASSIKTYMIEGEHSSLFELKHCERFVKILQQHLDNSNGN